MSALQEWGKEWKQRAGDTIRKEYEEALHKAQG